MKLTKNQIDALKWIYNEGGLDVTNTLIHKNTINSLYRKELITYFLYANCKMIQLTDKGLKLIK